jgi:hypothetical protein
MDGNAPLVIVGLQIDGAVRSDARAAARRAAALDARHGEVLTGEHARGHQAHDLRCEAEPSFRLRSHDTHTSPRPWIPIAPPFRRAHSLSASSADGRCGAFNNETNGTEIRSVVESRGSLFLRPLDQHAEMMSPITPWIRWL